MSTGPATIAVSRFDGRCIRTDHYASFTEMLADLLMNSGDEIPYLVRDKLLPPAIAAWDKSKKQDECAHEVHRGICKNCELMLEE